MVVGWLGGFPRLQLPRRGGDLAYLQAGPGCRLGMHGAGLGLTKKGRGKGRIAWAPVQWPAAATAVQAVYVCNAPSTTTNSTTAAAAPRPHPALPPPHAHPPLQYAEFNNAINNGTRVKGKTGTAMLPGSMSVLDRTTGRSGGGAPTPLNRWAVRAASGVSRQVGRGYRTAPLSQLGCSCCIGRAIFLRERVRAAVNDRAPGRRHHRCMAALGCTAGCLWGRSVVGVSPGWGRVLCLQGAIRRMRGNTWWAWHGWLGGVVHTRCWSTQQPGRDTQLWLTDVTAVAPTCKLRTSQSCVA